MRVIALANAALVLSCAVERESPAAGVQDGEDSGCAACHAEEARDTHAFRAHRSLGGGCLACHTAHGDSVAGDDGIPRLESKVHVNCQDCHAEVEEQLRLPFRHPVGAESANRCAICHSPHGGTTRELREHLRHDACVACHLEKAGPFLFAHDGDRTLQCLACHEPHGSSNPRLLTHHDSRSLCHSCHMNLEDVHREDPGAVFRECLQCHTEIHGSNWDREFFR
jgi:DmsE family decaheme c-type cytochrome